MACWQLLGCQAEQGGGQLCHRDHIGQEAFPGKGGPRGAAEVVQGKSKLQQRSSQYSSRQLKLAEKLAGVPAMVRLACKMPGVVAWPGGGVDFILMPMQLMCVSARACLCVLRGGADSFAG
jgi:hypothetical protein